MVRPAPPDFHSPGDIASWVTNRSCSRPGPDRPTSNEASSTLAESRKSRRAWSSVSACRNALGVMPGPAAEQMMQLGGADAGGLRDGLDLRLGAPVLGEERDGAAHDVVVGGGAAERREVGNAVGREHGCLHHLLPI